MKPSGTPSSGPSSSAPGVPPTQPVGVLPLIPAARARIPDEVINADAPTRLANAAKGVQVLKDCDLTTIRSVGDAQSRHTATFTTEEIQRQITNPLALIGLCTDRLTPERSGALPFAITELIRTQVIDTMYDIKTRGKTTPTEGAALKEVREYIMDMLAQAIPSVANPQARAAALKDTATFKPICTVSDGLQATKFTPDRLKAIEAEWLAHYQKTFADPRFQFKALGYEGDLAEAEKVMRLNMYPNFAPVITAYPTMGIDPRTTVVEHLWQKLKALGGDRMKLDLSEDDFKGCKQLGIKRSNNAMVATSKRAASQNLTNSLKPLNTVAQSGNDHQLHFLHIFPHTNSVHQHIQNQGSGMVSLEVLLSYLYFLESNGDQAEKHRAIKELCGGSYHTDILTSTMTADGRPLGVAIDHYKDEVSIKTMSSSDRLVWITTQL